MKTAAAYSSTKTLRTLAHARVQQIKAINAAIAACTDSSELAELMDARNALKITRR